MTGFKGKFDLAPLRDLESFRESKPGAESTAWLQLYHTHVHVFGIDCRVGNLDGVG